MIESHMKIFQKYNFKSHEKKKTEHFFLILFCILFFISCTDLISYLLFHTIIELFSIIIAFLIFVITWNSKDRIQNSFLIFLGSAFFFIGIVDLIHTLAFKGMNIFSGYDANLPTQLWIAARYIEAFTLIIAFLVSQQKIPAERIFLGYAIITTGIVYSIFAGFFPTCYIEDFGLTPFKIYSEYVICLMLFGSIALLYNQKNRFEAYIFWLILGAIIATIGSELAFTHYINVYGPANFLGHIFKFIAFTFIYLAIVQTGISRPFDLMYREIAESEEKFRAFFETSKDCVFITSQDGNWRDFNDAAIQLFGFASRSELQNTHITELYGNQQEREKLLNKISQFGFIKDYPLNLRKKDGSVINTLITTVIIRDDKNQIQYYQGTIRDITEQKRNEQALKDSEARLHSIIEGSPVLQFVLDCDHRIIHWNRAIEKFSELKATDMVGTTYQWKAFYENEHPCLADLLILDEIEYHSRWYDSPIQESQIIEGAYESTIFFPTLGTSGKWMYITAAPIRDSQGTIIGAIETVEDITDRKLAEDALKLAIKKLNLLSSITRHDILNELSILIGYLDLSKNESNYTILSEYLEKEERSAVNIQHQIEFTRDYEEMGIRAPQWQNIHHIITNVIKTCNVGNINISLDITNIELFTDPLLGKVFYNLVENAMRHGGIITKISFYFIENSEGMTIICEDNGNGIPLNEKENIFTRKYFQHTGLGLFLSREILSITGLTISETGIEGTGARFEIHVPKGVYRFA
nr:MASE3 domain-containing protein [uncultured Methanospirillum sp.]